MVIIEAGGFMLHAATTTAMGSLGPMPCEPVSEQSESGAESGTESGTVAASEERRRHATNLELFLDLVFVFAVTRVAGVLGSDLSPEGFGRGLLLAWLVWWLWSQFTWLGTAVRLEHRSIAVPGARHGPADVAHGGCPANRL